MFESSGVRASDVEEGIQQRWCENKEINNDFDLQLRTPRCYPVTPPKSCGYPHTRVKGKGFARV